MILFIMFGANIIKANEITPKHFYLEAKHFNPSTIQWDAFFETFKLSQGNIGPFIFLGIGTTGCIASTIFTIRQLFSSSDQGQFSLPRTIKATIGALATLGFIGFLGYMSEICSIANKCHVQKYH